MLKHLANNFVLLLLLFLQYEKNSQLLLLGIYFHIFQILERFRQGGFNTVVSTSVGEEGLDIGDVDLIVCYDASNSPIRLVQRMGRTGRKRNGRIVILVGEGKEEAVSSLISIDLY